LNLGGFFKFWLVVEYAEEEFSHLSLYPHEDFHLNNFQRMWWVLFDWLYVGR